MRFDLLFDDLEAQLDSQRAADDAQQHVEEERLRAARTALRDRLAALAAAEVTGIRVRLCDGSALELAPTTVGRDWFAAGLGDGGEAVVPLGSVASLALSAAQLRVSRRRMPAPPQGALTAELGIGVVLRDLGRRRVALDVVTAAESTPLHGTIDRVGADHFDLAVHERGAVRREASVLEHRIVALATVAMFRL